MPKHQLTRPNLVLCEGIEDCDLLRGMRTLGVIPDCDIIFIGDRGGGGFGIGGLRRELEITSVELGHVTHMALVADADEDPLGAFNSMAQAIADANAHPDVAGRYSVPLAPEQPDVSSGISMAIYVTPGGGAQGCLETMLLPILQRLHGPAYACAQSLLQCANLNWPIQKIHKSLVRATLSIINRENPACALATLWSKHPALIPADAPELQPIRDFLSGALQ